MQARIWTTSWLLLLSGIAAAAEPPGLDRLQRAIYLEETVGDPSQAKKLYQQIAADEQVPAATREQARVRLAGVLRKQGQPLAGPQQFAADEQPPQNRAGRIVQPAGTEIGPSLAEAVKAIEQAYAFPIDKKQFVENAIQSLVAGLDGESQYLTAEQFKELSHSFEQQLVGVGIQVKKEGGDIIVVTPVPGSPSEKAGVLPGDRILIVGETKLADAPEEERLTIVVKTLRGRAGEPVTLEIVRGDKERKKLTITRAEIQLESVRGDSRKDGEWNYLIDPEKKIGYIRILQFGARTADEVRSALDKLKNQEMKGLILDLRNNPGGLLAEGVKVCDLFVEDGKILTVHSRDDQVQTIEATEEGTLNDLPLAVLVNRQTASSAEVLAACLQDHERAAIVGERTFGRGIVQSIVPLKATGGALRITTGVFHRPRGTAIHRGKIPGQDAEAKEYGVAPSEGFAVEFSEEEFQKFLGNRSARDIPGAENVEPFEDRQLKKAMEHVREKIKP